MEIPKAPSPAVQKMFKRLLVIPEKEKKRLKNLEKKRKEEIKQRERGKL